MFEIIERETPDLTQSANNVMARRYEYIPKQKTNITNATILIGRIKEVV